MQLLLSTALKHPRGLKCCYPDPGVFLYHGEHALLHYPDAWNRLKCCRRLTKKDRGHLLLLIGGRGKEGQKHSAPLPPFFILLRCCWRTAIERPLCRYPEGDRLTWSSIVLFPDYWSRYWWHSWTKPGRRNVLQRTNCNERCIEKHLELDQSFLPSYYEASS